MKTKALQYSDIEHLSQDIFTARGHFCDLNLTQVYDTLIREAAKNEYYPSDLLYDLSPIVSAQVASFNGEVSLDKIVDHVFMFGFRDAGIDHNRFIKDRLDNPGLYGNDVYRAIYTLKFTIVDKDFPDYVEVRFRKVI